MARLWVAPLVAALAAFAIAPRGELVWDDQIVIGQQMMSIDDFADVLRPPSEIPQWTRDYFRPVVLASYLLDRRLFGRGTAGPHAANVVYHMLATFFVWLLLSRLLRADPVTVALAATLFAVHPVHTESVSWITGRSDLLATMFLVPALWFAIVWRDRRSIVAMLAGPLLFLLALLSKEVAITGIVILPVLLLLKTDGRGRPSGLAMAGALLPWLAALVAYFGMRAGGGAGIGELPAGIDEWLLRPARALAWSLQKLVVPWPQSNFVVPGMLPGFPVTAMILAAAAIFLCAAGWSWRRSGDGAAFAGLWWTGVAIAPSLAVTFNGIAVTPVAERYLYLPSVGAALAVGAVLVRLAGGGLRRVSRIAAVVLFAVFMAATVQRGRVWLSDLRLWTDTTSKVTTHAIPWVELGKARMKAGDADGALEAFLRARLLDKTPKMTAITEFNLGAMYAQRGQTADAERAFTAAIEAEPRYARGYYGLGRLLLERSLRPALAGPRRLDYLGRAAGYLETAVALAPAFASSHIALARTRLAEGNVWLREGDRRRAEVSYRRGLQQLGQLQQHNPGAMQRPDVRELIVSLRRSLRG